MIRHPSPGVRPTRRPPPRAALLFVAGLAVLFFAGGSLLAAGLGEPGMVAAPWLLLLLPSLLFLRAGGWDVAGTLSLRAPSGRALVAGLLLVAGATPLGWLLVWLQTLVAPPPTEVLEGMQRMLAADSPGRLLWLLLAMALTPAICEEVVFRGVLLGSTRTLSPGRFLLLNGLVFGAFHLSLGTWIRFLPTAWLGIVMAWAVWRTGSLAVGVAMHLANNGAIVLAAALPAAVEAPSDPTAPPPFWILPPALLLLAAGLRMTAEEPDARGAAGPATRSAPPPSAPSSSPSSPPHPPEREDP